MVQIHTLPLGAYETNCYLVWEESSQTCVVIDPGYTPEVVYYEAKRLGKTVEAILLTHGHFDHVGGVADLANKCNCKVYLCPEELQLPPQMTDGPLYYTDFYKEGDVLTFGGLTFTVLHTPGHSPGSVCLRAEDVLFTGDTLFAGSIGRTDFPGSHPGKMRQSLDRLARMAGIKEIYPGHGEKSTLEQEKRYNPFLMR